MSKKAINITDVKWSDYIWIKPFLDLSKFIGEGFTHKTFGKAARPGEIYHPLVMEFLGRLDVNSHIRYIYLHQQRKKRWKYH